MSEGHEKPLHGRLMGAVDIVLKNPTKLPMFRVGELCFQDSRSEDPNQGYFRRPPYSLPMHFVTAGGNVLTVGTRKNRTTFWRNPFFVNKVSKLNFLFNAAPIFFPIYFFNVFLFISKSKNSLNYSLRTIFMQNFMLDLIVFTKLKKN